MVTTCLLFFWHLDIFNKCFLITLFSQFMPTNASTNWRPTTATPTFLYRFQYFYSLFLAQQFNISSAMNSIGVPGGYSCWNSVATLRAIRLSLEMGEDGKRYALLSWLMIFLILLFMTFSSSIWTQYKLITQKRSNVFSNVLRKSCNHNKVFIH